MKGIYALGGLLTVAGTIVYLCSNEEQKKKYRDAMHNGLQAGSRDAVKHVTGKGLIFLAGVLVAKTK